MKEKNKSKLETFTDGAKILMDEIMSDKNAYRQKVMMKKQNTNIEKNLTNIQQTAQSGTETYSKVFLTDKTVAVLNKLKNKKNEQ